MNKLEEAAREYASCDVSEGGLTGLRGIEAEKYEPFIAGAEWQKKEFDKLPKSKRYRSIAKHNYCDTCVHFRPDEEGERKPVNELCEFVRPLKFRMPTDDEFLNSDDWGFYLPKCKDYKRIE